MSADVHPPTTRSRPAGAGPTRLPWWALVLPALVFCALLALMLAGGDANAPGQDGESPARILERLQQSLR